MRKKSERVELTTEMRVYIKNITKKFLTHFSTYENSYLKVSYDSEQIRWYPLKIRFTERYSKSIYAKLKPLRGSRLMSFWTLTSRIDGTKTGFHQQIQLVRKRWKDFRSLLAKDIKKLGIKGVKKPSYLRVYEITDNYAIHIHVAFFNTIPEKIMIRLMEYWNRNIGFVKVYTFIDHEITFDQSLVGHMMRSYYGSSREIFGNVTAVRQESWIQDGKAYFRHPKRVKSGSMVTQYVYKYMVKPQKVEKQAIIWSNRIRTYACSRGVSFWLRSLVDKFKEENKEQGLGNAINSRIDYVVDVEMSELVQKSYRRYMFKEEFLLTVNIMFKMDEIQKNFIELPVCVDGYNFITVANMDVDPDPEWVSGGQNLVHDPNCGKSGFCLCRTYG